MFFYIYQNVLPIFLFLDICLIFYIFLKLKHIKKEHFEVNFVLPKIKNKRLHRLTDFQSQSRCNRLSPSHLSFRLSPPCSLSCSAMKPAYSQPL